MAGLIAMFAGGAVIINAVWQELNFDAPAFVAQSPVFEPARGSKHGCAGLLSKKSIPDGLVPRKGAEQTLIITLRNTGKKSCKIRLLYPDEITGGDKQQDVIVPAGDSYPIKRLVKFKEFGDRQIVLRARLTGFQAKLFISAIVRPSLRQLPFLSLLNSIATLIAILGGAVALVTPFWHRFRPSSPTPIEQSSRPIETAASTAGDEASHAPTEGAKPEETPTAPTNRAHLPPVRELPPANSIKLRTMDERFAARLDDFWEVHDRLEKNGICIVCGTGGLGKTQLALEYAHRLGYLYPGGVYLARGDHGLETLIDSVGIPAGIEIDRRLNSEEQVHDLWKAMATREPALLILDNFPTDQRLQPYLSGSSRCRMIVTTQRMHFPQHETLELKFLSPAGGLELLNKGKRKFGPEAYELVEQLGGLPLALELVRNQLNRREDKSIADFQTEMNEKGEMQSLENFANDYLAELHSGHGKDVAATFQLSYEQASDNGRRCLDALAQFAEAPVPRRLLRRFFKDELTLDTIDTALAELQKDLALLELDEQREPVLHRLIRAYVRQNMDEERRADLTASAAEAIFEEMFRVTNAADTGSHTELEPVLVHAEQFMDGPGLNDKERSRLANYSGWQHWDHGRYHPAEEFRRRALDLAEAMQDETLIAQSRSNLALVLQDLGGRENLQRAREMLQLALEANLKNNVPGHSTTAVTRSNLAMVLKDLGGHENLQEAREMLQLALEAELKNYDPGHPAIAVTRSNLALLLKELGGRENLKQAREMLLLALEANLKKYDPGHPKIAVTRSNLATVLQDLGGRENLKQAREMLELALEADLSNYGPIHPHVAIRRSNLAAVLKDLGEIDEAERQAEQAHSIYRKSLGEEHASTQNAKSILEAIRRDRS